MKHYGIGNDSILRDRPIEYEVRAILFAPCALFRLPVKNWFLGAQYIYLDIEKRLDFSKVLPVLPELRIPTKTADLGFAAVYDSRDANLWPSDGTWLEVAVLDLADHFGGDFSYEKLRLKFSQYFPVRHHMGFVYRLDGQFIQGNPPFYDLSNVQLRSFPRG